MSSSASLGDGHDQVVNRLRWDGHAPLLECPKQLAYIFSGLLTLPRPHLSNSFLGCLFGFESADMEGQGRMLDVVVGEERCGVTCCKGSVMVVLKYSAIQRLTPEIKQQQQQQQKCVSIFEQYRS